MVSEYQAGIGVVVSLGEFYMECLEVMRKHYFKAEGLNLLARSDYIIK